MFWFNLSFLFLKILTIHGLTDICDVNWDGVDGADLCLEYGFCSSCVSNGCNWCSVTNRCVDTDFECGSDNMFGFNSLTQCNAEYATDTTENPKIFTTQYSARLAEIMSMYAYSAKMAPELVEKDYRAKYPSTFTLDYDSLKIFTKAPNSVTETFLNLPLLTFLHVDDFVKDALDTAIDILQSIHKWFNSWLPSWFLPNIREGISDVLSDLDKLNAEFLADFIPKPDDFGENQSILALDDVHQAIVISFRGTYSKDDYHTLIAEIAFHSLIDWANTDLSELQSVYNVDLDVLVSVYFIAAYNALRETVDANGKTFYENVQQYIEDYPDYSLYITGHSLGGALASIFALDLYADYYGSPDLERLEASKFVMYTFGQPRAGNEGFAQLMNAVFDYQYFRVVHSKDIVPQIPLWISKYRHHGIEIHYGKGDYRDEVLCQYRECTYLDPYEDASCRLRFEDTLGQQSLEESIQKANDNWLQMFSENFDELEKMFNGIEGDYTETTTIGPLYVVIRLFLDGTADGGFPDHSEYVRLGKNGHCNSFDIDSVKCSDYTTSYELNTDNYRCDSILPAWIARFTSKIGNLFDDWFENGDIFDLPEAILMVATDGCANAGDNMMCCLGGDRGMLTVCKEATNFFDFLCPANEADGYCEGASDCKGIGTCVGGICTYPDGVCDDFDDTSNDCEDLKAHWNLGIGVGDSPWAETDSKILFSYCINGDCSYWYKLDHCGFNDFNAPCLYEYFIIPQLTDNMVNAMAAQESNEFKFEFANCGNDGLLIDQIKLGHRAEFGYIDEFITADGVECDFQTDTGLDERALVIDGNGGCEMVSLLLEWNGVEFLKNVTVSTETTTAPNCDTDIGCATESNDCEVQGVSADTTCASFSESSNDCDAISTEWNLKIGVAGHSSAGTDDQILFSYCITNECSEWYKLDNCDHNDFKTCVNEYFIVPSLNDDMANALQENIDEFDFYFANCGDDGLLIDHISIGHEAEFGNIDVFEDGDEASCRFSGTDERVFAIDEYGGGNCAGVKVHWNSASSTSSTIYKLSSADYDHDAVCAVNPGCAGSDFTSQNCQVKAIPPDTTCSKFSDSSNTCSSFYGSIALDWNLLIGVASHSSAGTDDQIMFSYCIDGDCGEWFKLDNCGHNDFKKCVNEYFIVESLNEDIENALQENINEFSFYFVNCGNDGLLIDHIALGYDAEYGTIHSFESGDGEFCRFSGEDDDVFAIDGNGNCRAVSVLWNGGYSSTIYKLSSADYDYDAICAVNPGCADDDDGCKVKSAQFVSVPAFAVYVMGGILLLSVLLFVWNISICCKDKFSVGKMAVKYQRVSVESSAESVDER